MTEEYDDLLTGPDEGSLEPATGNGEAVGGNGEAARPLGAAADAPSAAGEHPEAGGESHAPPELPAGPESPAGEVEPAPAAAPKPAKSRAPRAPVEETPYVDQPIKLEWYILKVQSNREDSIADALRRRIAIAGLGEYFDEIIVPTEKVSEFKGGKKRVVKRKIYPGYIVVHMELNDDTWFLVRETPGIGDFTGSGGKPSPMSPSDVHKIVAKQDDKAEEAPRTVIPFSQGDRVRINEGTFENFEGEVDNIDQANGRVTIMINIFGRSTPVELEYWQVEKL